MGAIKNRTAELRWWAEKIGKENVIARDNDHDGAGNRWYVTKVSKARELGDGACSQQAAQVTGQERAATSCPG